MTVTEDKIINEIRSIANPVYFERCNISRFQMQMIHSLKSVISFSSSSSSSSSLSFSNIQTRSTEALQYDRGLIPNAKYDPDILDKCLFCVSPPSISRVINNNNTTTRQNTAEVTPDNLKSSSKLSLEATDKETRRKKNSRGGHDVRMERLADAANTSLRPTANDVAFHGIQWNELCTNHDTLYRKRKHQRSANVRQMYNHHQISNATSIPETKSNSAAVLGTKTALEEVIGIMINPNVIPPCCSVVLIIGLIMIFIEVSSSSTTLVRDRNTRGKKAHHQENTTSFNRHPLLRSSSGSLDLIQNTIQYLIWSRPNAASLSIKPIHECLTRELQEHAFTIQHHEQTQGLTSSIVRRSLETYNVSRASAVIALARDLGWFEYDGTGSNHSRNSRKAPSPMRGTTNNVNRQSKIKTHNSSPRMTPTVNNCCHGTPASLILLLLLKPILVLLKELDAADTYLLHTIRMQKRKIVNQKKRLVCQTCCTMSVKNRRNKRIKTSTVDELHDHFDDDGQVHYSAVSPDLEVDAGLEEVNRSGGCAGVGIDLASSCNMSFSRSSSSRSYVPSASYYGGGGDNNIMLSRKDIMSVPSAVVNQVDYFNHKKRNICPICSEPVSTWDDSCINGRDDSSNEVNELAYSISSTSNITALPFCLIQYRADLYNAILDIAKSMKLSPVRSKLEKKNNNVLNDIDFSEIPQSFRLILNEVTNHPQSASLRLCTVMMAEYLGIEKGYMALLDNLLKYYLDNLVTRKCMLNPIEVNYVLNTYCEVVAECNVFDDANVCWNGVRPLVILALELDSVIKQDPSADKITNAVKYSDDGFISRICRMELGRLRDSSHTLEVTVNYLLRCIGYLLVRRKSVLFHCQVPTETKSSLNACVVHCSEVFGDQKFWTHDKMTESERTQLIFTLQFIGVLSFVEINYSDDDSIDPKQSNEDQLRTINNKDKYEEWPIPEQSNEDQLRTISTKDKYEEWPFAAISSMRAALVRIGPKVKSPLIFTRIISDDNADNPQTITKKNGRQREDSMVGEPLMDYIDNDPLRVIFSFFGYKQLVRMTSVCKKWNEIGNENQFWRNFYIKRFKSIFPEDHLLVEPSIRESFIQRYCLRDWRRIFDKKWLKERSLRGKFTKIGRSLWKRKVCNMIGCLVSHTNDSHRYVHQKGHTDDIEKKVAVVKRAALRLKRKQVQ